MDKHFGNVIWTNHALQRLSERGIKQGDAWATWRNPDYSRYAATKGAWVYYKTWDTAKIEVVAKQNEAGRWVILSVWSDTVDKKFGRPTESLVDLIIRRIKEKVIKKKLKPGGDR